VTAAQAPRAGVGPGGPGAHDRAKPAATGESAIPGAGGTAAFALLLAIIAVIMSMGALLGARKRNKPGAG
jgi:hypothetical protein